MSAVPRLIQTKLAAVLPQIPDLTGLELSRIGCTLDLLWMQFGSLREISDRRGRTKHVGQLALHVNVPWRISDRSMIVIGNRDLYFHANGDCYDSEQGGDSRFHLFANSYNAQTPSSRLIVQSAATDHAGGLQLQLSDGYRFEAFPNVAHNSPGFEFWRLFAPWADGPHLVRETGQLSSIGESGEPDDARESPS